VHPLRNLDSGAVVFGLDPFGGLDLIDPIEAVQPVGSQSFKPNFSGRKRDLSPL
jgi:hypothetical protein